MEQAGVLPLASFRQNAPCVLAPHAEEHRSGSEHAVSPASLRCDASRSMRAHALARLHPSRRAHARSNLPNVFGMRAPQDEDEHRGLHSSPCQTAHLVPVARFRARALHLCCAHPETGWAERRETFGCSGTRWAYHLASKTRVNALMTRDARLSALHRGVSFLRSFPRKRESSISRSPLSRGRAEGGLRHASLRIQDRL